MENVCLGVDDDSHMYAVGSKAHTDLLDARTLQVINFTLLESIISIGFNVTIIGAIKTFEIKH